jgi:alkylation response protein AidB-like acyl-CoA dehydrogenase
MDDAGQHSSAVASMAKIWSSEFYYRMTNVATQIMGPFGQLQKGSKYAFMDGEAELGYRNSPPSRFGGGANEVQRDIIAKRGLGLPRSRR